MVRGLSFEEANNLLCKKHNNSIILLEYNKISFPALFQCVACDHTWKTSADNVIRIGAGCPRCSRKRAHDKIKLSDDHVLKYIESKNCKWLGGIYNNIDNKLLIQFSCEHIQEKTFDDFKLGNKCSICGWELSSEKQRTDKSVIVSAIEQKGFKFIDFPNGYKNRRSEFSYRCLSGHVTTRRWGIFQKHPRCGQCYSELQSKLSTNTDDHVQEVIISKNARWVDGNYTSNSSKLLIEFECGHLQEISYGSFRSRTSTLCYTCTKKNSTVAETRSSGEVINIIKNAGFIFCKFLEEYHGQTTKFEYICNVCNHANIKSVAYFINNQYCEKCKNKEFRKSKKGDKNHWWKGGISRISLHLRHYIGEWYAKSLQSNNYLCVITNKRAKVVHHLYPFYKVVEEYLEKNGLNIKNPVGYYSNDELIKIEKEFSQFHELFGLGVPLTKNVHDLFHRTYGTMNNTPAQFEEFRQRIQSGDIIIPE